MNAATQRLIGFLKEAHQPYIVDNDRLVCNRSVFVISPSVESEQVKFVRLDMPKDVQPADSPFWMLFFMATIGAEKFCDIRLKIKAALSSKETIFIDVVGDWKLSLFWEDGHRVLLAEAMSHLTAENKG